MDLSPSFNTHSCINITDIANRVVQELHNDSEFKDLICFSDEEVNEAEENTQIDEFEFPLVFTDSSVADNIINDQITPRYPLFDRSLLLNLDSNSSNTIDSKPARASASAPTTGTISTSVTPASPPPTRLSLGKLFSEDRDSTQSSTLVLESKDFNTISSPQTFCIWKPQEQEHQLPPKQHHSRGKHKKSNSISISSGDTSPRRWRVRDLLKRSYSDDSKHTSPSSIFYSPSPKQKTGKDGSIVVFLPPILPKPSNEKVKNPEKALKTTASMGGRCTNHKPEDKCPAYTAKVGNIRLPAFLPYRQDQHQVDAFANYTNNGPTKHMYR